jgi:hypothetical protein
LDLCPSLYLSWKRCGLNSSAASPPGATSARKKLAGGALRGTPVGLWLEVAVKSRSKNTTTSSLKASFLLVKAYIQILQ